MSESFDELLRAVARAPEVHPRELAADEANLTGLTLGRFRVKERLGRGGMGSVYRAFDERLTRDVALKVLRGRGGEGDREALLREARSAAAVRHRGIAQIHDVGEIDGVAFLAMELVEGETLRARVARVGALPVAEATRIARALAAAVGRAHAMGLVHLDLKPDNVMIDRDGDVKVLDFGLARRAASGGGQERGMVRGTPAYMAPEQAAGAEVSSAADVFALGVTWQEIVTGAAPSRALRAEVPRSVAPLLARCLAVDPAARFCDGAALAAAIDRAAQGRRGRRWLARAAWALGVAVALAAAGAWRARAQPTPATPLRRLTANVPEVPILHAALSPDGESLAYVDGAGLHVARLGSPEVRDVALGVPGSPLRVAWLPDARSLLVVTASEAGPGTLARVPLDGASTRALAAGRFSGLAPSHDGARVAVAEGRRVAWLDADGGRHPLAEKGPDCSVTELAWSPDDARVAWTTLCFGTLGDATIESAPTGGGPATRIVSDPRLFSDSARAGLLWSPRGDIVYPRAEWLPAESGSNLWSLPVDREGRPRAAPKPITSWVGTSGSVLSEDASGGRIAFLRSELQSDVYVGELTDGGMKLAPPRKLTLSDRNERPSAWSRDSRVVYFFSDRTGSFDIFQQPVDGGPPRPVAAETAWETMPQVSPDGSAILYWRFPPLRAGEPVRPDIVRRPLGEGEPAVVAREVGVSRPAGVGRPQPWEMRFRCPSVAGASCVLSEREGESLVFHALDPIHGRGPALTRAGLVPGANAWGLSPDGTRLAIPRGDGRVLVRPLDGGADRDLDVAPGCDALAATWNAAGDGLFVTVECASEPPFRLYAKKLAGPLALLWSDGPNYVLETEASPDGRYLAIAVKSNDDDVWAFDRP